MQKNKQTEHCWQHNRVGDQRRQPQARLGLAGRPTENCVNTLSSIHRPCEHPIQHSRALPQLGTCWALIQTQLQSSKQLNTVSLSHDSATTSPNRILLTPDSLQGLYLGWMSACQNTDLATHYCPKHVGMTREGVLNRLPKLQCSEHLIKR